MTICRVWKNEVIDRQAMIEILNEFRDQHLVIRVHMISKYGNHLMDHP